MSQKEPLANRTVPARSTAKAGEGNRSKTISAGIRCSSSMGDWSGGLGRRRSIGRPLTAVGMWVITGLPALCHDSVQLACSQRAGSKYYCKFGKKSIAQQSGLLFATRAIVSGEEAQDHTRPARSNSLAGA